MQRTLGGAALPSRDYESRTQDFDTAYDLYAVATTTNRTLREVLDMAREDIFDAMLTQKDVHDLHVMGIKV
jgi:hypothetical protein